MLWLESNLYFQMNGSSSRLDLDVVVVGVLGVTKVVSNLIVTIVVTLVIIRILVMHSIVSL